MQKSADPTPNSNPPTEAAMAAARVEQADRFLAYAEKQRPFTDDGTVMLSLAEQVRTLRAELAAAKADSKNKSGLLKDWQDFAATLGKELGCGSVTDDITKAVAQLRADLAAKGEALKQYEGEKWDFNSLTDLYNADGAPLVDFIITHMLSVFDKALGGKGWTAYESDGGLDEAISYEINALLEKNQAIDEWDHRPLGPLLIDLIRLSDKESKKGKFRITLDYDNYQDGGRVLDGDEQIIGECYESREGNADEDGPNAQIVGAIIVAVDAALSARTSGKDDKGEK